MKASLPYKYIQVVFNTAPKKNTEDESEPVVINQELIAIQENINTNLSDKIPHYCVKLPCRATAQLRSFSLYCEIFSRNLYADISLYCYSDFFSEWLTAIKPNAARTTYQCYNRIMERFMKYMSTEYPDVTLADLNHSQIQTFLNYKMDQGLKGSDFVNNT